MNNEIQNKLSQFEALPPAKVWEEIAAALDSGVGHPFAEKLAVFEQDPPASLWQKINRELGEVTHTPAKVVPFFVRYRKSLKYSAAVAGIIVLAVVGSLLITKKTVSEGVSVVNAPRKLTNQETQSPLQNTPDEKQVTIAHLPPSKRSIHIRVSAPKTSFWLGPEPELKSLLLLDKVVPEFAERTTAIDFSTPIDKYMVYSDGDGNAFRLSKKLFDAFACPTDKITCKQKIKRLQEQVATSAMSPGFTGILDMLKELEENQ